MKKGLLFLLLAIVSGVSFAQDTLKTKDLKNAFQVSRQLIAMERRITQKKLTGVDSLNIRSLMSSVDWYAGMQDADRGVVTASVSEKLRDKYTRLDSLYTRLKQALFKVDLVLSENANIDSLLNKHGMTGEKQTLLNELAEYAKVVAKKNEKKKELDAVIDDYEDAKMNVDTISINRDALIKTLTEIAAADTSQRGALLAAKNDTGRITKAGKDMDVAGRKLALARSKFDAAAQIVSKMKTRLEKDLISGNGYPTVQKLLARIANVGDGEGFEKYVNNQNEQLAKSQREYLQEKEAAVEQASARAINFRMPTEAEMIDAIAIYLAKRVKQEAVMFFFETVKKNAKNYELLKTFFPNTITLLQSNEVYEIPNLGSQWRYALSKDFVKMPRNVLASDWFRQWQKRSKPMVDSLLPDFLIAVYDVCDLVNQQYGYNQMIKQMYLSQQKSSASHVAGRITPLTIFSVLYAFNQECFVDIVGDTSSKTRLLGYEDVRNMTRDEMEIMISLMDIKYGEAFGAIWRGKDERLFLKSNNAEAFRLWIGTIETAIKQFNKIQEEYVKLGNAIREGKKVDAVYDVLNVWDNINSLLVAVIPDTSINNPHLKIVAERAKEFKENMTQVLEIYHQLSLKNYAGATNAVIALVEEVLYNRGDGLLLAKDTLMAFSGTTQATFAKGLNKYLSPAAALRTDSVLLKQQDILTAYIFEQDRHAINIIRRLAGFLNDVMLTTDSKQLAKVVESYSMPPGSYKRKRNSWMSVDLNAYVGAYAGFERSRNVSNDWGGVYGITAPIGITISKTFGLRVKKDADPLSEDFIRNPDKIYIGKKNIRKRSITTLSLSVNIVDIGAVVAYRFSNTDSTSKGLPKDVNWSQVISPGVRFGYGIPNTPLVASLGWQYTPKLRSFNDTGENQYNTHRFSLGVLIDLPLANFWQQSYRKSYYLRKKS